MARLARGNGRADVLTLPGYNSRGDVVSITDPRGNLTTIAYDAARRLIATAAPNGLVTVYSYDRNGQTIEVQQSTNGTALRSTGATYTLTGMYRWWAQPTCSNAARSRARFRTSF